LLVLADDTNITGEGMGIGAVAAKSRGYFCFSRNCTTMVLRPGVIEKKFLVDSRLLWGRSGLPSVFLTRILDHISEWYMRWRILQPLLSVSSPVRSCLGLKPFFEPIPPIAEARFTYRIDGGTIDVSCTISPLGDPYSSVVILNELAADAFTNGFREGNVTPPPSGWLPFEPGCDLYDPARHIRFCISRSDGEGSIPRKVIWGREYTDELRWAGFAIEFEGSGNLDGPFSCSYQVSLVTGPPEGGDLDA
jgi:hypothetical protein